MKSSMFLFAALVLCALPSAMGAVWCWDCTPNMTHWCNMMDQYMMKLCMNDNSSCYMASVMVASVKTYTLGCLEMDTCDGRNTTICSAADTEATNNNQTVAMCNTMCTMGNGTNNPMPMNPTSTMTMTNMKSTSVTTTATTTTAAVEKLCPTFLGVLFIILFTILRQ